ncbi:hypothetical protein ACMFMG_006302 [Clarireedia jacksonii]
MGFWDFLSGNTQSRPKEHKKKTGRRYVDKILARPKSLPLSQKASSSILQRPQTPHPQAAKLQSQSPTGPPSQQPNSQPTPPAAMNYTAHPNLKLYPTTHNKAIDNLHAENSRLEEKLNEARKEMVRYREERDKCRKERELEREEREKEKKKAGELEMNMAKREAFWKEALRGVLRDLRGDLERRRKWLEGLEEKFGGKEK